MARRTLQTLASCEIERGVFAFARAANADHCDLIFKLAARHKLGTDVLFESASMGFFQHGKKLQNRGEDRHAYGSQRPPVSAIDQPVTRRPDPAWFEG
jgi:hypothetical protein